MTAASRGAAEARGPIRVVRIIARLNIGGPAIQAITLTRLLEPLGYATTLIRGTESPSEGNMDSLARSCGVTPVRVASLRRDPGPGDLMALVMLGRLLRKIRPQIVHTHAAKGGTLGRLAALLTLPKSQRVLVHTFHGHSLSGYFSAQRAGFYLRIERFLARRTARLIAVSDEVRDELVELGVAPPERFQVIKLGFDLSPFVVDEGTRQRRRAALRAELSIPADAALITTTARLVPIKRVDRFLRVVRRVAEHADVHALIVGDGELGSELRASADAAALGDRVVWAGFRDDIAAVCFASDLIVLTSDSEGTPVSLIEAQAAAVPTVTTDVGGVRSVVLDGDTGRAVPVDAEDQMAEAILEILGDRSAAERMGERGRAHTVANFSVDRLVKDLDMLYRRLLNGQQAAADR